MRRDAAGAPARAVPVVVLLALQRTGHGFGFDPIFVPDGHGATFGELLVEIKNNLSHRGQALAQLVAHLRTAYENRQHH